MRIHNQPWLTQALISLCLCGLLGSGTLFAEDKPGARLLPIEDQDFYRDGRFPPEQVELGRLLFFDKILSGNKNISCATCHHPDFATSDGVSLSLGEGALGLGPARRSDPGAPVSERMPRNSQALFNVGAREYERMFHDGRVELDPYRNWDSGIWSPAREQLPAGVENVLVAQAMFPVTSAVEMAGLKGENPVATAAAVDQLAGPGGVWDLLAQRLRAIPEYVSRFQAAFPEEVETVADINFVRAATAIAAFETVAFRSDDSPFDDYLTTGDASGLGRAGRRGMELFYGKAGCASCHGGKLLTDHGFHAIAMPQIGPGKLDGWDPKYWQQTGFVGRFEDFGRFRETAMDTDRYRFRTPSLRNVALTGPWGHAGAFTNLEAVVRHHLDPVSSLESYDANTAVLPPLPDVVQLAARGSRLLIEAVNPTRLADFHLRDQWVQRSPELRGRLVAANELRNVELEEREIDDLVAFLHTLTGRGATDLDHLTPQSVPSGLPVDRGTGSLGPTTQVATTR